MCAAEDINSVKRFWVVAGLSVVIAAGILIWGLNAFVRSLPIDEEVAAIDESANEVLNGRAVRLNFEGCENLHRITENLYRGAQPGAEGFKNLENSGIKTVVNLRTNHDDEELLEGTSLRYVRIAMNTWAPKHEDVAEFLKIATEATAQPVFIHCKHGADRTGTMVAAYRVVVQGWTKERAVREMTAGGFGYHPVWKMLPRFVEQLDAEKLRKELGLKKGN